MLEIQNMMCNKKDIGTSQLPNQLQALPNLQFLTSGNMDHEVFRQCKLNNQLEMCPLQPAEAKLLLRS